MTQPNAQEQYMLELINRARQNPLAEASLYGIDLNQGLSSGRISSNSKQPLAFNLKLIDSSRDHSQWMLDTDNFSHTGVGNSSPGDRMKNAGYDFTGSWTWGENIAWQGTTGTPNFTQYITDEHEGLFKSPGHRLNILEENFREIGIGANIGEFNYQSVDYNSVMTTQNFAKSGSSIFLTGVAFDDRILDDDFYTVGEGLGGIEVEVIRQSDNQIFSTTTMNAGGYQIALAAGTYEVNFFDNNRSLGDSQTITIGSSNIKLDLNTDELENASSSINNSSLVTGTSNSDSLIGGNANQEIKGFAGDDYLDGGAGADLLRGGNGDDRLIGGRGNDKIIGWEGDDILIGVDPTKTNRGYQEIDRLSGNGGKDTFVLGDVDGVYYNHGGTRAESWQDRAIIGDFDINQDTIQLHGSPGQYQLVTGSQDTKIFYGETETSFNELIAIVKNVTTDLDLLGSQFTYL